MCLTAFSCDGIFCINCCLGATAKKLNEKASLYEGHGFSRAVNRLCSTASAAEVRFSKPTGLRFRLRFSHTLFESLATGLLELHQTRIRDQTELALWENGDREASIHAFRGRPAFPEPVTENPTLQDAM
jgi:hypothetical protein